MTPTLCPDCLAENRIATRNGPTCTHQPTTGADWFPHWWNDAGCEARRAVFLEQKNAGIQSNLTFK